MNARIVLIDDDEDDRMLFREAMKSSGHEDTFEEYTSGETFINYMEGASSTLPEIIFLDINMPSVDGYTLLNLIRANDRFCKSNVVMFTTSSNQYDIAFAEQNHASGFAAKPSEYNKLEAMIQNAIQHFLPQKKPALFFTMV
ncbi:MAG: response regulator [Bacteroidia bacterium]